MPRMRSLAWGVFGFFFVVGLIPPDKPWLMFIGLTGFIGACFIPKDF